MSSSFALARVISSVLAQLAKGTPLWKISIPAFLHCPKSLIEMPLEQFFGSGECLLEWERIDSLEDPLDRLASVIKAIFNVNHILESNKPLNPVEGEILGASTMVEGKKFEIILEQISHYPPVTAFRVDGPSFSFSPPFGIPPPFFRPNFNSVDLVFENTKLELKTKTKGTITVSQPGFNISPLFSSKRVAHIIENDFWIMDGLSGYKFQGSIKKDFLISGSITNGRGETLMFVEGHLGKEGILNKADRSVWVKGCKSTPVEIQISDEMKSDPWYTGNVWAKFIVALNKKDYAKADIEKVAVEVQQRIDIKEREQNGGYTSRFGFMKIGSDPNEQ